MTRVAILGGGPAGLGAAYRLRHHDKAEVVVFERGDEVGGNAGSFVWNDHWLDFGSHRLHPACDPGIMADVRGLLGDDLLDRPRHGRIRLLGRWVHFPLKPVDLLLHVHPSFALGSLADALLKPLRKRNTGTPPTFGSVLMRSLGPTICKHFYFPYARKIWGLEPDEMDAIQAERRVASSSFGKLVKKVLSQVPGLKPPGSGRFFYPREGFGQISRVLADAARSGGADVRLGHTVTRVAAPAGADDPFLVTAKCGDEETTLEFDHVWSTIPVTVLARMLDPAPPEDLMRELAQVRYRAMVLIYLELPVEQFTEFDAHYLPGADVRVTRLSETKNYADRSTPAGRTVICAELPCNVGDEFWSRSDEELGKLMMEDLERSGLPLPAQPIAVTARRLPAAYPMYQTGYEAPLAAVEAVIDGVPRLLSYGRQGLFAHDNTHHALAMAYGATDCLNDGTFDLQKWAEYLQVFETHVVED